MKDKLVGRKEGQEILLKALHSDSPEMVAVFGRRRVGKTFLVKQTYNDHIVFEMSGIQNTSNPKQLLNFTIQLAQLSRSELPLLPPATWLEAFFMLSRVLEAQKTDKRQVVFLDEVPWLAGRKSGFLTGLSWFWNSWAEKHNIVVVICGSAASWMIQKIVNDRGGLHNRITQSVFLDPFTLSETEAYLQSREVFYDRYQIVQIYMALGGIPHYLKGVEPSKSATQNINDICFSKKGLLRDEFSRLYVALFANAEHHLTIVRTLSQSNQGLSRPAIVTKGRLPEGGNVSKVLDELEQSGFITSYYPFGNKKKDMLYRLTDEYSLFYLQFIEQNKNQGNDTWHLLSQTQSAKTWAGYAYENICLKHLPQIKKAMSILGIYSSASAYFKKGTDTEEGMQIDLILDRNDHTINLFEIKFYNKPTALTREYADKMRQTLWNFQEKSGTNKQVNWVFISTFGLTPNAHSVGLISQSLTLDDLF